VEKIAEYPQKSFLEEGHDKKINYSIT
jgi:hypothetical protein